MVVHPKFMNPFQREPGEGSYRAVKEKVSDLRGAVRNMKTSLQISLKEPEC